MAKHIIDRLKIHRYSDKNGVGGYSGWIEPNDLSWIIFIDMDGKPSIYYKERSTDGSVIESSAVIL